VSFHRAERSSSFVLSRKTTADSENVSQLGRAAKCVRDGSDRRSFELNYEKNILIHDPALTAAMRARQQEYTARSHAVTKEAVAAWPVPRRLWNNVIGTLGSVL
jgi:hypothetical protein